MKSSLRDQDVKLKSTRLQNKKIGLAVCGGIACVETVKLSRELRRHGASVRAFVTPAVKQFLNPMSLEWATTTPVTEVLGADVEHLEEIDLLLLAPLTLNTLSKIAVGICDNAVTQMAATCVGRKTPLVLVPTMNAAMANHPLYSTHLETLRTWGADLVSPLDEENRLKFPALEQIVTAVVNRVGV